MEVFSFLYLEACEDKMLITYVELLENNAVTDTNIGMGVGMMMTL